MDDPNKRKNPNPNVRKSNIYSFQNLRETDNNPEERSSNNNNGMLMLRKAIESARATILDQARTTGLPIIHHSDVSSGSEPTERLVVRFWSNAYTVGDGDPQLYHTPGNITILDKLSKGEVPEGVTTRRHNGEVQFEDYGDLPYEAPTKKAFSGRGYTLGTATSSQAPPTEGATTVQPTITVEIDASKPKTVLQIRLNDGTRVTQEFNHSHTIADVRSFISSRSTSTGSNFVLMTTFPSRLLSDEGQTLTEANLLNAVVVQKLA